MTTIAEIILNAAPIWDSSVWEPLQQKNYQQAQLELKNVLQKLPPYDWADVNWSELLEGIPAFRGNLEELEWEQSVRPLIIRAVFEAATAESLSILYLSVDHETRSAVQNGILSHIRQQATTSGLEPAEWLKNNKPFIYHYLKANLAQDLGIEVL